MRIKDFTPQIVINKILNRIGNYRFSHLSIPKTIVTNFRCFNFKTAIKFPIYIYSQTKIYHIGRVIIEGEVRRGMIRIGHHRAKAIGPTRIFGYGTYIVRGRVSIWGGCILENNGTIILGKDFSMGESCIMLCVQKIEFGDKISIGFKNTFMDASFHYLLDRKRKMTFRDRAPIYIGGGTWITSDCKIMQGASLPPNSVLVANSVLKNDYSDEPQYQMYAGDPAKKVRSDIRRIFNRVEEKRLHELQLENPERLFFKLKFDEEDEFCLSNSFIYRP